MQTWSSLLNYIKLFLGAPLNLLEMGDTDIVENIKEHVLPQFSQYSPCRKYTALSSKHLLNHKDGDPRYVYQIPREIGEQIIDIMDVFFAPQGIITEDLSILLTNYTGAIDTLIQNTYLDQIRSIQVRQTWDFLPPDKLIFDKTLQSTDFSSNSYAIVHYGTIHKDLETIDPDLYTLAFQKLALGNVQLWLAAMRSKYENLSSPFGAINVNYQQLEDKGQKNVDEAIQFLNNIPPDHPLQLGL